MDPAAKFFRACRTGNVAVLRQLLSAGMDVNAVDEDFLTGLIWAGRKGRVESADILLAFGADIEGCDKRGRTALFHAAVFNRADFVRFMAGRGARVNPVDCHGCTPLDVAIMDYPRPGEVVKVLESLGGVYVKREPQSHTATDDAA